MGKFNFIKLALAATLLMGVNQQSMAQNASTSSTETGNAVYRNIMTRTSVRAYQEKLVEEEKIDKLLRAGMAAPSAVNRQPWHFVVVTDRTILDRLADANPNARFLKGAPLAIVVCGDLDKALEGRAQEYWIQDCSAATENILLAAHGLGLGAVWTGTYPSESRCKAVAEVLQLPESIVPLNTLVIGYPQKAGQPKDKWNEEKVSYNRYGQKK